MMEKAMQVNAYKLTTHGGRTRVGYDNETQWGENVTHTTSGEGELGGPGWLHYYTHPLLAVLLNSIHAEIVDPALWECHAAGKIKEDRGLKCGCTSLTTLRRIPLPVVTTAQRVRFAILCARQVHRNKDWLKWADKWLSGEDRSGVAARAAAYSAAYPAARAAYSAAYSDAYSARDAAYSAACSAAYSARVGTTINLIALAEQAIQEEQSIRSQKGIFTRWRKFK